jgi:hypothetical protein
MQSTFWRFIVISVVSIFVFICILIAAYLNINVTLTPDEISHFTLPGATNLIKYDDSAHHIYYIQYSTILEYPKLDAANSLNERFGDKKWIRYKEVAFATSFGAYDVYDCNMISNKRFSCWRIEHYKNNYRSLVAQVEYWYISPTLKPSQDGFVPDNDKLNIVIRVHPSYEYTIIEVIARIWHIFS